MGTSQNFTSTNLHGGSILHEWPFCTSVKKDMYKLQRKLKGKLVNKTTNWEQGLGITVIVK